MFLNHPQSSKKELAKAMTEILAKVKTLSDSNYYLREEGHSRFAEWEVSKDYNKPGFFYSYDIDVDGYYGNELTQNIHFYLSDDSTKIVLNQYKFANYTRGSVGAFGAGFNKYREFRNAEDFLKKAGELIQDRTKNLGSSKDLDLSDYYPAYRWRNMVLSSKDHSESYKYKE